MKVGIISFNKYSIHLNYGAALHSYAFQKYLDKINVDSIIIDYLPLSLENYNIKYPILNNKKIWDIKPFLISIIRWSLGFFPNIKKFYKFQNFFNRYYRMTVDTFSYEKIMNTKKLDDYEINTFVCESDVIWKIRSTKGQFDKVFFLNFPAAEGKRKIAYAPSIGSELFTEEQIVNFKKLTKDFYAISTRERQGAIYLKNILNKEIQWVLDPTLLLYQSDYEKILIEPKEKNYLLVYNCMINDKKMLKQAKELSQKLNLKLIEISVFSENRLFFNHKIKNGIGIEEFLGYFKNASFIVTNAFHGLCFSLIFKKEFFLFLRDSSDYRMINLVETLNLCDRLIHFDNKIIPNQYNKINFDEVDAKLEILRKKSYKFIEKNICPL